MRKIRLTQDAYACGGSVRAGGKSVYELTKWYEAAAEDADGNIYRVIWEISNPDAEDESDVCDWSEPWAILDEHYNNVSDTVTLKDGKMLKDIQSSAAALYDGGWRAADREQLIAEYELSADEADAICEKLRDYEDRQTDPDR